ncbi:MAG: hypothetical protein ACREV1_16030 [Gammaproteobacteria bacterium]
MNREEMKSLWRNELSAIAAYQETLGAKEWKLGEGDAEVDELFRILVDHVQAASLLGTKIRRLDVIPAAEELEPPGKWSKLGTLAGGLFHDAHVFSDKAGLKVLKGSEECSLEDYEHMLQDTGMPRTLKPLISKLVSKQRTHIRALSGLVSRPQKRSSRHEKRNARDPLFCASLRRSNDEVERRSPRIREARRSGSTRVSSEQSTGRTANQ